MQFIVTNNSVTGTIRVTGLPKSYRGLLKDNIDLGTFAAVKVTQLAQEPVAAEKK